MAGEKKFNWFGGVFVPSLLTILGVIMYLRLGYVVGNQGLWGALFIVLVAHIISITTGLSISSVATDKKVGAGGVYYVLSRSLGLPIGGAIGLTLFVGTAFSIALYLVGFAESFSGFLETATGWDLGPNNLRIIASSFLLILTILAFISTSLAIKTQFFILGAIIVSLISIFFASGVEIPDQIMSFGNSDTDDFSTVFAIFFPAVTGFTAGIAMSGDLKNPKKAIPVGTLASIFVGLAVYIGLTVFLSYNADPELLRTDNNILMNMALWPKWVLAGIWGATLSSALGGILGGPRILQAMSIDKITPKIFGKGVGKSNEPRNALIFAVIIAECGILIGELDMIASIVSMFFLAAYGFINISFFLESWASTDFSPSFKVNKWIGMLGFLATFLVMSQLNMQAMFGAFIIIGGIYVWLTRKQINLGTGDVWQSVWTMIVKKGLHKMEKSKDHKRNWKANMLLFSGNTKERPHLLQFSKALTGQAGMVTNFDLIENQSAATLFPKSKEKTEDEELERLGIFGRQMEVQNIFKGIETISMTFGFSGIEPNSVLMGWQKNTKDPIWFAEMTQKLISLDYNVLYLDYDKRWGFKDFQTIDLWWRDISNSAELMLSLTRFLGNSSDWRRAKVRILFMNNSATDYRVIKSGIDEELKSFRVNAEIKVINNKIDQKPIYELMKLHSSYTDLVMIDIPDIEKGDEKVFVEQTNSLVEFIGTTLLVKASSHFDETVISLQNENEPIIEVKEKAELSALTQTPFPQVNEKITELESRLNSSSNILIEQGFKPISNMYYAMFDEFQIQLDKYFDQLQKRPDVNVIFKMYPLFIEEIDKRMKLIPEKQLSSSAEILENDMAVYLRDRRNILKDSPKSFKDTAENGEIKKITWKTAVQSEMESSFLQELNKILCAFGVSNFRMIRDLSDNIQSQCERLIDNLEYSNKDQLHHFVEEAKKEAHHSLDELKVSARGLYDETAAKLSQLDRTLCNRVIDRLMGNMDLQENRWDEKELKTNQEFIANYANYWKRNQILFHNQTSADLMLNKVINAINRLRKQVENHIQATYFKGLQKTIDKVSADIDKTLSHIKDGNIDSSILDEISMEEGIFFNPENLSNQLAHRSNNIASGLPEEIEVMKSDSLNDFGSNQGIDVISEKLVLDKITDYIIETKFIEPSKKEVFDVCYTLQNIHNELLTTVQSFIHESKHSMDKNDQVEVKTHGIEVQRKVTEILESFQGLQSSFKQRLKHIYDVAVAEMDIHPIIKEAEELEQFINKEKRRKGLDKWVENAKASIQKTIIKTEALIDKDDKESTKSEFLEKHKASENIASVIGRFIYTIELKEDLKEKIPFYYRQLFTGKHLSVKQGNSSRIREIEELHIGINKLKAGISGAIMITGESLSGKSFLVEQIAKEIECNRVNIIAPEGGSSKVEDIQLAFQRAFNSNKNVHQILKDLNQRTTIVLDDIELWWRKSDIENGALKQLINLINAFGMKHYFILTSNIYSYKHICSTIHLERVLVGTALLPPLSHKELSEVIAVRHRLGNLQMIYKDQAENEISERRMMKLMDSIHEASGGNIGLALRLWLSSIDQVSDQKIHISEIEALHFPEVERMGWKVLLFQMILHKSMQTEEIMALFHTETKSWVNNLLKTLVNSGLLEEKNKNIYRVRKSCTPYIEEWLNRENILR